LIPTLGYPARGPASWRRRSEFPILPVSVVGWFHGNHRRAYDPGGDWPDELKPRLLGVQACLWSENLHDRQLFDHMTLPRLSAIAESAWTPSNRKHFGRFMAVRTLMPGAGIE
jgi:hypothetical protein